MISSLYSYFPAIPTIPQIVSNAAYNLSKISSIAFPIIAVSAIPIAKAGPIAAAACFVACEAFLATLAPPAAVAYAPYCFAGCKVALVAPIP